VVDAHCPFGTKRTSFEESRGGEAAYFELVLRGFSASVSNSGMPTPSAQAMRSMLPIEMLRWPRSTELM